MFHRKVIPDSKKTRERMDKMPKIYVVSHFASYGVREYPYVKMKRYKTHNGHRFEPLVYDWIDMNGSCSDWVLTRVSLTEGDMFTYTFSKTTANRIADALNGVEKW